MFRGTAAVSSLSCWALAVLAGAIFIGCATPPNRGVVTKAGEIERQWIEEEAITAEYIFARGIGAADPAIQNKTQKMATSRNASIVNAQYNMLSIIRGALMSGGMKVEKGIEADSALTTKINAVIKNAQIIRSEWTSDDGCVVLLRLPVRTLQEAGFDFSFME